MSWQLVIVIDVEGEQCQLTQDEARELIGSLREPNPHVPAADPGSIAAAVMLERLLENPGVENPPMTDEEAGGLLLALARMYALAGLSERQATLHDALLAYAVRRNGRTADTPDD